MAKWNETLLGATLRTVQEVIGDGLDLELAPLRIEPTNDNYLGDFRVIVLSDISGQPDLPIGRLLHLGDGMWSHTERPRPAKPSILDAANDLYRIKLEGIARNVRVLHKRPLDGSTQFYSVSIGARDVMLTLYFSYSTIVGFETAAGNTVVCHNQWGTTTGRHLNYIDGGCRMAKARRLSDGAFKLRLAAAFADLAPAFATLKLDTFVEKHHHNCQQCGEPIPPERSTQRHCSEACWEVTAGVGEKAASG